MDRSAALRLRALLGDYPVTRALRSGALRSASLALDFADVKTPHTAFKRVVRELEFDVAELAIVTFLMALGYGKPLALLPAVVMARFQHPYLVHDAARGRLAPRDLEGKRVGVRSYSVTTGAWIRDILAEDYGVDVGRIRWVTFEEAHVAEFCDPPSVERAPAGADMTEMLFAGELDAAILGTLPADPRLRPVIADPQAEAEAWRSKRGGAIQINHMVVVKRSVSRAHPQAVREFYRLLAESKRAAGLPQAGALDLNPFGLEATRRSLEVAIECVYRQGLVPRRFAVEELFDEVTVHL